MADAAMSSSTRCLNAAAAPLSESKRTQRRPGASRSMTTTAGRDRPLRHHDLEQQVAVGGSGAQRLEGPLGPLAVSARVDEHHRVARGLRRALCPAQDPAEERVRDVGDE